MPPSQEFHISHSRGDGGKTEGLQAHTQDIYAPVDSSDDVYHAKAKILNDALQEIGMGKYQWCLFVMAGFGWFSVEIGLMIKVLILTSVTREFNVQGEWMLLAQALGLLAGAIFWGVGCDLWGRRWSFNLTLLIIALFTLAAAAAPNYATLCACMTVWSFGVGGNVPVDSTIFIEFVPPSHQYLLTVLAVWWSLGDLVSSLVAWPLISNFSCPPAPAPCPASSNRGWRYFVLAMGGIMMILWIVRFFVFNVQESPKYLMGHGKDEEAVAAVHRVASVNGKTSDLSVEHLKETEKRMGSVQKDATISTGAMRKISTFHANHVRMLFSTRTLAYSTSILVVSWGLIGLAFPLFYTFQTYYLQTLGVENDSLSDTYRNQVISYFLAVPAALMAGYLIEVPILGRRRTLSIFTVLTGAFIFLSTTARTTHAYVGWYCGINYASTVMYAVLFNLSSELFPTKARGIGNSMVLAASYGCAALTPIITLNTGINSPDPIWVAGGILVATGFLLLLVPIEPRGRGSVEIYDPDLFIN